MTEPKTRQFESTSLKWWTRRIMEYCTQVQKEMIDLLRGFSFWMKSQMMTESFLIVAVQDKWCWGAEGKIKGCLDESMTSQSDSDVPDIRIWSLPHFQSTINDPETAVFLNIDELLHRITRDQQAPSCQHQLILFKKYRPKQAQGCTMAYREKNLKREDPNSG